MADATLLDDLRRHADDLRRRDWHGAVGVIEDAIALIERLTPRPMTLEGLAKELNELRYDDSDKWTVQDGGFACGNDCECLLDPGHVIAIVKFLRRSEAKKEAARA
jgi:hypothetical protein